MSKLIKKQYENIDFFYSSEIEKEGILRDQGLEFILKDMWESELEEIDSNYKRLIELNKRRRNLNRNLLLIAHGNTENKNWVYYSDQKSFKVQNFLNKLDGKYELIFLSVCNPQHHQIRSKKSAIIHFDNVVSGLRRSSGEVNLELYIPGVGYADDYTIASQIKALEEHQGSSL